MTCPYCGFTVVEGKPGWFWCANCEESIPLSDLLDSRANVQELMQAESDEALRKLEAKKQRGEVTLRFRVSGDRLILLDE